MTLEEIRNQIWYALGEPTDLDPSTDTSYNSEPLLNFVANEGQRQIAKWKDPVRGYHVRIESLIARMQFSTTVLTDTISSVNNSTFPYTITVDGDNMGSDDDRYNEWMVEITSGDANGEVRMITDWVGSTLTMTIHDDLSSTPSAGDTLKVYKRFEYLLPSTDSWVSEHIQLPSESNLYRADGNFVEILKIIDLEQQQIIRPAPRSSDYPNFLYSTGDPRRWYRFGNKLYFDNNIDENRWFIMEYYRLPSDMSSDSDEPEIPEMYHWAIVLWGKWWGLQRNGETSDAYAAKRDLEDEIRRTKSQADIAGYRTSSRGQVVYDFGEERE